MKKLIIFIVSVILTLNVSCQIPFPINGPILQKYKVLSANDTSKIYLVTDGTYWYTSLPKFDFNKPLYVPNLFINGDSAATRQYVRSITMVETDPIWMFDKEYYVLRTEMIDSLNSDLFPRSINNWTGVADTFINIRNLEAGKSGFNIETNSSINAYRIGTNDGYGYLVGTNNGTALLLGNNVGTGISGLGAGKLIEYSGTGTSATIALDQSGGGLNELYTKDFGTEVYRLDADGNLTTTGTVNANKVITDSIDSPSGELNVSNSLVATDFWLNAAHTYGFSQDAGSLLLFSPDLNSGAPTAFSSFLMFIDTTTKIATKTNLSLKLNITDTSTLARKAVVNDSIAQVREAIENAIMQIEPPVGGYANNIYFDTLTSIIDPAFKTLTYTPSDFTYKKIIDVNLSEGNKIIDSSLYPSGVAISIYPSGIWSFTFYGHVSSTTGDTRLGVQYFKRSLAGVDSTLFTVWSNEINNTADDWIIFSLTLPSYHVNPTDKMGARILAKTTSVATQTITVDIGNGYGAFINTPNRIRHSQLRDLNGDTSYLHVSKQDTIRWVSAIEAAGGGGTWGSITGTLSSQTDLQTALDNKLSTVVTNSGTGNSLQMTNSSSGRSIYINNTSTGNGILLENSNSSGKAIYLTNSAGTGFIINNTSGNIGLSLSNNNNVSSSAVGFSLGNYYSGTGFHISNSLSSGTPFSITGSANTLKITDDCYIVRNDVDTIGTGSTSNSNTFLSQISMPVSYSIPFTHINTQVLEYTVSANTTFTPDTVGSLSGASVALDLIGTGDTATFEGFVNTKDSSIHSYPLLDGRVYTFLLGKIGKYTYPYSLINDIVLPGGLTQLATPSVTGAAISSDSLRFYWSNITNNVGYKMAISSDNGSTYPDTITLGTDVIGDTIAGLTAETRRDVKVQALADGINFANSNWSTAANATTLAGDIAFSLTTNSGSADTFNPSITVSSGVASWNMGDGTTIVSNTPSKSYADGTTKTVNVSLNTIPTNADILTIAGFSSKKLLSLDLSSLTGLRGSLQLQGNPGLASVLFPTTSQTITEIYLNESSASLTSVNLSPLQSITGPIYLMNNSALTSVTFPTNNTGEITYLDASGCNITGTFNVGGIHRFSGTFSLLNQTNCDSVVFTNTDNLSTNSFTTFSLAGTTIRNADLSHITNLSGTVNLGNVLLKTCLFPTSSKVVDVDLSNAKLTTLDVSGLSLLRKLSFDAMALTSMSLPTTSQITTWIKIAGTSLDTIDVSTFSNLAGDIYLWNNNSTSTYIFPSSSQNINTLNLTGSNSVLDTLPISTLTGLGTSLSITGHTGLKHIPLPATSRAFTNIVINSTALDSIEFDNLTGAVTNLNMSSNTSLDSISGYSWISTATRTINFQSCSLDVTSIDAILAALNTYFSANAPTGSLTLTLNSGTNAAPTGGNDNTDAVNLQSVFTTAGQTLTYVHN